MKSERIYIRIKPEDKAKLQAVADKKRRTITSLIEEKIEDLLEEEMAALSKENLYETIANQDGTMDLRFDVKGETVWVKGVKVPDDIDEFYWDDDDHVRKAVESGQNKI